MIHARTTKSVFQFLGILMICLVLQALTSAYFFASMPLLGRQLGFSDLQTGILLGLGSAGLILISPLWGYYSEIWGRRPILRLSLLGIGLTSPAIALILETVASGFLTVSVGYWLMIIIKICQTVMTAGLMPVAQACIADITHPAERRERMAYLGAAFGIGSILGGSLLWGISPDYSVSVGYWVMSAMSLPILILAYFRLDETRSENSVRTGLPSNQSVPINWHFLWPFLAITFLSIMIFSALKQMTGLYLQDYYHIGAQQALSKTGMILMLCASIMIFAQIIVNQVIKAGAWYYILVGALVGITGLSILWIKPTYALFVTALLMISFALGLILPANLALLSLKNTENIQGKIAGLNASGQGCAMVISPILTPIIMKISPSLPFQAFIACLTYIATYALIQICRKG